LSSLELETIPPVRIFQNSFRGHNFTGLGKLDPCPDRMLPAEFLHAISNKNGAFVLKPSARENFENYSCEWSPEGWHSSHGNLFDMVHYWTDYRSMEYLTVSTAKPKLGRLLDRVLKKGSPVVIRRGNRYVQLSEYVLPDPIPERPPGFFAVAESPAEYERANRLTSLSPDRPE
jgi:hypothetical protein